MAMIIRASSGEQGIPAGFPILLSDEMRIIEPAFAYLLEQVELHAHSPETVRTYSEHLYDWFDSLEQSGIHWRSVDEGTIASYRNRMLTTPSPHTARPYARSTINDRVRSVCRFYAWAHRRRMIDELPFSFRDAPLVRPATAGFLAHTAGRPAPVNTLSVTEYETLPRPLRVSDLHRLRSALDMPYRLMAEWAVTTGMRRMELCALATAQIPRSERMHLDNDPLVGLALTVAKGGRRRTVYPPLRLLDRTNWYIGEERAALIKRLQRLRPDYQPPPALFLNRHGRLISRARLSAAFADAFAAAELNGSAHWLRHTFAMIMLVRLQTEAIRKPEINPLKVLQVLLGHASIQTTAIYLRCVELHAEEVADAIEYLYGSAIGDAA
jgi:site-specific recombinase XerD